jgi:hypothetical protein
MAIKLAESDIRRDLGDVPSSLEVVYYDPHYKDCAVTLSANTAAKRLPSTSRADLVERYAITGFTRDQFKASTNEAVYITGDHQHPCYKNFQALYSTHGPVSVCWDSLDIVGYCRDGICLSK